AYAVDLDLDRRFFFQAEDGIRDRNVTGVQTCALPIYPVEVGEHLQLVRDHDHLLRQPGQGLGEASSVAQIQQRGRLVGDDHLRRSEERRVGKECRGGQQAVQKEDER